LSKERFPMELAEGISYGKCDDLRVLRGPSRIRVSLLRPLFFAIPNIFSSTLTFHPRRYRVYGSPLMKSTSTYLFSPSQPPSNRSLGSSSLDCFIQVPTTATLVVASDPKYSLKLLDLETQPNSTLRFISQFKILFREGLADVRPPTHPLVGHFNYSTLQAYIE